tara:strand:- start:431 stop:790 length:360 start_codon:yes stop_codon:yes gene_type:complete
MCGGIYEEDFTGEMWMNKKPMIDRGLLGGVTLESAVKLVEFLKCEADMDDDLTTVEYYNGMLEGLNANMAGEICSEALEREIKAYGIQTCINFKAFPTDDRSLIELGEDRYQDRPKCPQ